MRSYSRKAGSTSWLAVTGTPGSAPRSAVATRRSCSGCRNAKRNATVTASGASARTAPTTRSTSRSASGSSTPAGPMRSATPTTCSRATSGGGCSRARSYSDARSWRRSHSRSSNPSVVTSTTRAPRRSSRALVAMVVPCTSRSITESRVPPPATVRESFRASRVPSRSTARNIPTVGSSGVVVTLRTSSVPSAPSATRSVNVPPTSTPTLIPTSDCGLPIADCGFGAGKSVAGQSAIRNPQSAISPQALRTPFVHGQHASEPEGRQHGEPPHPIPQPHVQRGHVARAQGGGDRRLHLECGGIVVAAQRIDGARDPRVCRACDAHAGLDGPQHQVRGVLVRPRGAAVPRVVRHVDEEVRAPPAVRPREVLEHRLVADQHAESAHDGRVERQAAPLAEAAEPLEPEPPRIEERDALDDRHEIVFVIDRVGAAIARRIIEERGVVVVVGTVVVERGVEAAGQDGRARLARTARHGGVPLGVVDEVARHGGLGPDQEIEPRRCPEALGQAEQPAEHAILTEAVPLLAVALVRLHQSDHADIPHGQRAHPPRAVAEREENGPQHGPDSAHPPPPPPPGPTPFQSRTTHQFVVQKYHLQ